MQLAVDRTKCQGHNRCVALSPALFELDEELKSSPRGDGIVPPELEADAQTAVNNCPERAITLT